MIRPSSNAQLESDVETLDQFFSALSRFVETRLIPREREIERKKDLPPDLIADLREMGLFGLAYPEEYGGLGLSICQEMEVGFVLGRAAPALRNVVSIHNGVAGQCVVNAANEMQARHYLPRLATGEIIAAIAMTEPDVGSDVRSVETSARRVEGGWIINGRKRFISNATIAGLFTVVARTSGSDGDRISLFLVEPGTPGFAIGQPENKMGQHGAPIADLIFDDCRVGEGALLGREGEGLAIAMGALDRGRLFISACCVGLALRLIDDAAGYALERHQFGQSIANYQLIQALLADSLTETYAARSMVREAARSADREDRFSSEASMCKYFATEMVGRVADRAVQIHGGNGYIADYSVEQIYRDVRVLRLYEGTSQIQQLIIARNLLRRRTEGGALI